MDAQEFAFRILDSPDPHVKLAPPEDSLEIVSTAANSRFPAPDRPHRDQSIRIVPGRKARVPALEGFHDKNQRVRILHALANHEFQAVELFAWAFLRFPEAPKPFRMGLLQILLEEQEHTRLYIRRLEELGAGFGQFPVSGFFWNRCRDLESPEAFICAMSLTFENANLDHSLVLSQLAQTYGDRESRRLFDRVHEDEKRHVRFGMRWLPVLRGVGEGDPERTLWNLYLESLPSTLEPGHARGSVFHHQVRQSLGFQPSFIEGIR